MKVTRATREKAHAKLIATRVENLKKIVEQRFKGNATACAKALDRSQNYIWQLLNGHRSVGEDTARYIEEVFGLKRLALDESGEQAVDWKLKAHVGDGQVREYLMVPQVDIETLLMLAVAEQAKKSRIDGGVAANNPRPCPVACSERTVYFEAKTATLDPLVRKGELIFTDPDKRAPLDQDKLYVVIQKKREKGTMPALIRMACLLDDGWRFAVSAAACAASSTLRAEDVHVYGRVILTMRDM